MRECQGCDTPIDTSDGVTVIPAKVQPDGSLSETVWWHPDCRNVELRKLAVQAVKRNTTRRRDPEPVGAPLDEM